MIYKEQKEQIDNNIFARARAMMCGEYDEIIDGAEIEELQERIDKAIIEIDTISIDDLENIKIMEQKLNNIKSILQDEEVK